MKSSGSESQDGDREPQDRDRGSQKLDPTLWGLLCAGVLAVGMVALLGALGKGELRESKAPSKGAHIELASGKAPVFSVIDALTGKAVTNKDFNDKQMLLFFSEGASHSDCMHQVTAIERKAKELKRRNIVLVSISVDSEHALKRAADDFNIKHTPLLADSARTMSTDYDMLGKGGVGFDSQDGHAFMLVDADGEILWEKAYLEMFVEPDDLFKDIPKA